MIGSNLHGGSDPKLLRMRILVLLINFLHLIMQMHFWNIEGHDGSTIFSVFLF